MYMMTEYAMGLNELLDEHKGTVSTRFVFFYKKPTDCNPSLESFLSKILVVKFLERFQARISATSSGELLPNFVIESIKEVV